MNRFPNQQSARGPSARSVLPRAVSVAVVAVPRQRPPLVTAMVTDVEQTLLDLADRPGLGTVDPRQVGEAIGGLAVRADWEAVLELARRQRLHAGYVRARWVAGRVRPEPPPPWSARRPVPGAGLVEERGDEAAFGIADPHAAA